MSFRASSGGGFFAPGWEARCALGHGGTVAAGAKREGDGATPLGVWPLRRAFYRSDREAQPDTQLPLMALEADDGWCDAPHDPRYNRPVKHPYGARAEALWREDGQYDLIIVLGHNDDPVIAGRGSAIFLHLAAPDWRATAGCVAIDRATMLRVLNVSRPGDVLEIADR